MSFNRSIHLSLHIHKTPDVMAERAAHLLVELCEQAIAERGIFNLAISGGTTPIPLFNLLASPDWAERLPWEKIALYWVDERCIPSDAPDSNYGMARRTLLSKVPASRFYRMRGDMDPVKAAYAYEELLHEHFDLMPGQRPRFDCVLLGMGEDGHTASLFPNEPGLEETERLVIDQYIRSRGMDRLTLTLPVLNNARHCLFLVSGAEKHEILQQVLNPLAPKVYPAQFVRPPLGDLVWIIDEAAATGKA